MAYSKEFEEWVIDLVGAERHAERREQAHFWLSAFARLVREEATKCSHKAVPSDTEPCWMCVGRAFNALCERFGLTK